MSHGCPNSSCLFHQKKDYIINDGYYFRSNDSRKIKRLKCTYCSKRFSHATFSMAYHQKKRRLNLKVFNLLSSGVSMRRIGKILKIHRMIVKRKLVYLAQKAKLHQQNFLELLKINPINHIQFDDLITIEHTKLKPLTITIAIDASNRKILAGFVGAIPSFGLIAELSRKKYGKRKDEHNKTLKALFETLHPIAKENTLFETDEFTRYPFYIKKYFPEGNHIQYKSAKGSVAGQGELKKQAFDPIFQINHTLAMLRANISRLIRRTWNTTKCPQMLQNHIDVYIHFHNSIILSK